MPEKRKIGAGRRLLVDFLAGAGGGITSREAESIGRPDLVGTARQMLSEILAMPDKEKARAIQDLQMQGERQRQEQSAGEFPLQKEKLSSEATKNVAEAKKYTGEAAKSEAEAKSITDLGGVGGMKPTPDDVAQNVLSMKNDATPLSVIGGRMGSFRSILNAAYNRERTKNPSLLTPLELEANSAAELKRAATLNSQQTQDELVAIHQFNSAIDGAIVAMQKIKPGNFIPLNKLSQSAATKLYAGNKQYADQVAIAKALTQEISLQSSRVFSGTAATDIRVKQELDRLNTAQSLAQFMGVAQALKQIAAVRANGIMNLPTLVPAGVRPSSANMQIGTQQLAPMQPANTGQFDDLLKKHGFIP